MLLSQIINFVPIEILHNGEFLSLGLLSHSMNKMLVGLYDANYIAELLNNPNISCVVTTRDFAKEFPKNMAIGISEDPKTTFYNIHEYLYKHTNFYWTDFDSDISPDAHIHPRAFVASQNVRIGRGTIIEPNATILERSIIGENVIIRAGAVIGGEGYEPKYVAGKHVIISHAGGVLIGNRVEIQALTHVVKSVFNGFTEIGDDTKIDALVHVGHNARIGCCCEIAACSVIGGSSIVEDEAWIGPNATISSEVNVGKKAFVTLGAVVTRNVADGKRVSGNFAIDHSRFLTFIKSIR